MEKKITRTFKLFKVMIKDSTTGEILREELLTTKPKLEKLAVAFVKATGQTNFTIDIVETVEQREMSVELFITNSELIIFDSSRIAI